MRKIYISVLFLGAFYNTQAQNPLQKLNDNNTQLLVNYVANTNTLKSSSLDFFANFPDSIIFYTDSLENIATYSFTNVYAENKITSTRRYFDNSQWINDLKMDYFLDNSIQELKFEPILGGSSGNSNGYEFTYESSIGDSTSIAYYWNEQDEEWIEHSKTKHHVSELGIDTLAITYIWDSISGDWELNNIVRQNYIQSAFDTIHFTMFSANELDTLLNYSFVYSFNENSYIDLILRYSNGYLQKDSLIYNDNGFLTFEFKGDEEKYDYLYEHRYDQKNRKISTFFWDKQSGQVDWEFDGTIYFYYPIDQTSTNSLISYQIAIYPNPASDYIIIPDYRGTVTISNLTGQVIKKVFVNENDIVDIKQLNKGVYLIVLDNGLSKKVVIN